MKKNEREVRDAFSGQLVVRNTNEAVGDLGVYRGKPKSITEINDMIAKSIKDTHNGKEANRRNL